jgi:dephospho-CoA kinase
MPFIGLTGGFGMGKTTVLHLFSKLGAYTVNVDKLVHDILKKSRMIKKITSVLGEEILIKDSSGILTIDKKRIADIIFNEPQRRRSIEKIIHPEVLKMMKTIKTEILIKNPSAIIICEVPLLFEAGYEKSFDKVIVVYCTRDTAINRLIKRGFTKVEILRRMRAQMPITKKKTLADFLIDNNNGLRRTETQVKQIFYKLRST